MSDNAVHLIAIDVADAEAEELAKRALAWLTEQEVVGAPTMVERRVGNPWRPEETTTVLVPRYPPGPRAMDVVQQPDPKERHRYHSFLERNPNHVEVTTERRPYGNDDDVELVEGALAITFWNWWPLQPWFIEAFAKALGQRLARVYEHL